MILGLTYFQICWYFLLYSFLGWCTEVVFHAFTMKKLINRGFLNGPVCPVYGFGMIGIFIFIHAVSGQAVENTSVVTLFLAGTVICTLIELIAGWLLDIIFHARWWDYRSQKFNFKGYICLKFSVLWGLGVVIVVRYIHPLLRHATPSFMDSTAGWIIMALLYAVYLFDVILTVSVMIGLNKKLDEIDKMRDSMRIVSDTLTVGLGDATLAATTKAEEMKLQTALLKNDLQDGYDAQVKITKDNIADLKQDSQVLLDKAKKEFDERYTAFKKELLRKPHYVIERILKAYPSFDSVKHHEIISDLRNLLTNRRD